MLRPAQDDEIEMMLTWRNQEANRAVSNHQHVISLEEHQAWWQRVGHDPTWRHLVFEYDGRPLGVVTFFDLRLDEAPRTGSWGFYLDNETTTAEGTAMMAWMQVMKEACAFAFDELGLDVLNGEVLAHNEAVRLTNRRFRFTEGEPETRTIDGRTIEVIPISLRREDRRPARGSKK